MPAGCDAAISSPVSAPPSSRCLAPSICCARCASRPRRRGPRRSPRPDPANPYGTSLALAAPEPHPRRWRDRRSRRRRDDGVPRPRPSRDHPPFAGRRAVPHSPGSRRGAARRSPRSRAAIAAAVAPCSSPPSMTSRLADHPFAPYFLEAAVSAVAARPPVASSGRGSAAEPAGSLTRTRTDDADERRAGGRRPATMPEGDTIFRAARTLQRALAGLAVIPAFDDAALATGDRRSARPDCRPHDRRGHAPAANTCCSTLSGDLVLRTHMRMHGSWHIYRPGERWRAPRREARIVLTTAALGSPSRSRSMTPKVRDPRGRPRASRAGRRRSGRICWTATSISTKRAAASARRRARHIAEAILRQQSVAGLGNVFKSELLFLCGVLTVRAGAGRERRSAPLPARARPRPHPPERRRARRRRRHPRRTHHHRPPQSARKALGLRPRGSAVPEVRRSPSRSPARPKAAAPTGAPRVRGRARDAGWEASSGRRDDLPLVGRRAAVKRWVYGSRVQGPLPELAYRKVRDGY